MIIFKKKIAAFIIAFAVIVTQLSIPCKNAKAADSDSNSSEEYSLQLMDMHLLQDFTEVES